MNEEMKQALLKVIDKFKGESLTGNIQINFFQGKCGTIQIFDSYKEESFLAKFK
jgi:hypothetical protein